MTKSRAPYVRARLLSPHTGIHFLVSSYLCNLIMVIFNLDWKRRTFFPLPKVPRLPFTHPLCVTQSCPCAALPRGNPVRVDKCPQRSKKKKKKKIGKGKFAVPKEMISWGMTSWAGGAGEDHGAWLENVQMAARNGGVLIACLQISRRLPAATEKLCSDTLECREPG